MKYSLLYCLWHLWLADLSFFVCVYKLLIWFDLVLKQEIDSDGPLPLEMILHEIIMVTYAET